MWLALQPADSSVEGTLPSQAPLVAGVGSIVRLRIGAAQDDHVVISGLGVRAPVGPGSSRS